ncbi:alanyl-tRNA editing protein [Candidatus Woesearchaeota archaeon]|nr:alanyl-tRNA editing protein [Candidatus Woesearchaeota archaeon]
MTELLYLKDCYLKEFDASVIEKNDSHVILDRTIFYPQGGGQPCDKGTLNSIEVTYVKKSDLGVMHFIKYPINGNKVHGIIDWSYRYKLMRMHTAQHVISAIVLDSYDAETVGNQIGFDFSRIDFFPFKPSQENLDFIRDEFNKTIDKSLNVKKYFSTRQEVIATISEKRRNLFSRVPETVQEIRVVEIENLDKCPCGGTHVDNLGEIGHINIIGVENKGLGKTRFTFELL